MSRVAIVCVDDDEIILSSLEKQLKRSLGHDYNIELASNGDAALILCAELEAAGIAVALVISDQTMPGISGDDFLIKLHANYPKTLKILLTGGTAASSIGNLVNEAALIAARNNAEQVEMSHLELAKDKVLMGPERKSMVFGFQEKKVTAYHEAGHCIVAKSVPGADPVHKITIIPRG